MLLDVYNDAPSFAFKVELLLNFMKGLDDIIAIEKYYFHTMSTTYMVQYR